MPDVSMKCPHIAGLAKEGGTGLTLEDMAVCRNCQACPRTSLMMAKSRIEQAVALVPPSYKSPRCGGHEKKQKVDKVIKPNGIPPIVSSSLHTVRHRAGWNSTNAV